MLLVTQSYYKNTSYDWPFVTLFISINLLYLVAAFYPKYLKQVLEAGVAKMQLLKDKVSETLPPKDFNKDSNSGDIL